jgi:hypothetical protein
MGEEGIELECPGRHGSRVLQLLDVSDVQQVDLHPVVVHRW